MSFPNDSLVLSGGGSSLTLSPALGGKISSLRLAGREWLWTSDVMPQRPRDDAMRADDASYVKLADTGGHDECFPTVGACTLPSGVPAHGGLRLPDHGELWSQQPEITAREGADGMEATVSWSGSRMPYTFVRSSRIDHDGQVTMRYSVTNKGASPMPFLWSAHPLLPLTERTRLLLPGGARVRVNAAHGFRPDEGDHRWPTLAASGSRIDVSRPASIGEGNACKLFLDLPRGPARASVEEAGARLNVDFDGSEVTHLGLWINNRGWTPFENGRPYQNLAFEPCIGAPDSLAAALGPWDAAAWLPARERREWTLRWMASRA